ncbi:class C sortase [Aerococcus urinaeequi]|uniref:class C sortase n=1 Tax=Aerococcus urinaeequi TaxID=51665 RepID=UPI003B4E6DD1
MEKSTKKKNPIVLILIFFIGLAIVLYPLASRVYYNYRGNEEVASFQEGIDALSQESIQEKLKLGYAYNSAILSNDMRPLGDPYSDEEKDQAIAEYARMIEVNEKMGAVHIPSIDVTLPIYAGTNEQVLQKGAGHLEGTSLPIGGLNTHSVITAHRGLPENKLFTDLDKMAIGDLFYVETIAGQLAYEVVDIQVIEPTQIETLAIQEDRDLVTLLTCTPYMVNSHRLLVTGERTEIPVATEDTIQTPWWQQWLNITLDYKWLLLIILIIIIILVIRQIVKWRQAR